jgi:hypothetical protein
MSVDRHPKPHIPLIGIVRLYGFLVNAWFDLFNC